MKRTSYFMSNVDRLGVKSKAILNSNTDPELRQNCESNYEGQYFDIDMLKLGVSSSNKFFSGLHRAPFEDFVYYVCLLKTCKHMFPM